MDGEWKDSALHSHFVPEERKHALCRLRMEDVPAYARPPLRGRHPICEYELNKVNASE